MNNYLEPAIHEILSGGESDFHQLTYRSWKRGTPERTLICLPGVSRNSLDFQFLANQLLDTWHVISPDMPGRGLSETRAHATDFGMPANIRDAMNLIAHVNCNQLDLLGTSMGGIMGIILASRINSPIKRLVLNDVGPYIPAEIFQAVSYHEKTKPQQFATFDEALKFHKANCSSFGPMTDEQWIEFTKAGTIEYDDGTIHYNYHQKVHEHLINDVPGNVDLWHIWDKIQCPVLVIRGENSIALPKETFETMSRRGPETTMVEIPESGHAPHLLSSQQTDLIRNWLLPHPGP